MKRRELVVVIIASYLLNIIYNVYWFVQTRRELVTALKDETSIPRVWSVFKPFVFAAVIFAVIEGLIWSSTARGLTHNSVFLSLWALLVLVLVAVTAVQVIHFLWRYCHALARLTKAVNGTTMFWIWLACSLVGFTVIGVAWAQHLLNQYSDRSGSTAQKSAAV